MSISQCQTIHEKNSVQFQGYIKYNGSRIRNESLAAPKKFSGKSPSRIIFYKEVVNTYLHALESVCAYGCFELCL